MSNSVDNRVVQMEFDNAAFERGVSQTIESLKTLNETITELPQNSGIIDVFERVGSSALSSFSRIKEAASSTFNGIIDSVLKLGQIGQSLDTIKAFASNGIIGQMLAGGKRRALNIEQARFQLQGLLSDAEKYEGGFEKNWPRIEQSINDAVNGTRYGYDAAARAAGQLLASNVGIGEEMDKALRAISGVASMTNSEYEDISQIFTRIAGQGRVMANDLNSIAARGLNAAATLAEAMGVTEAEVRDMTSKGKIDFMTFANAMNNAFGEQATKANETYSGALANMKAALNRIGAEFYVTTKQIVDGEEVAVGGLESMRKIFVAMIPVINGIKMALGPLITTWREWTYRGSEAVVALLAKVEKFLYFMRKGVKTVTGPVLVFGRMLSAIASAVNSFIRPIKVMMSEFVNGESIFWTLARACVVLFNRLTEVFKHIAIGEDVANRLGSAMAGVARVVFDITSLFAKFGIVVGDTLLSAVIFAADGFEMMLDAVSNLVNGGLTLATAAFDGFVRALTAVGEAIRSYFVKDSLGPFFSRLAEGVSSFADAFTRHGFEGLFKRVYKSVRETHNALKEMYKGLSGAEKAVVRPFMNAIKIVRHFFGSLNNIAKGYAGSNPLLDWVTSTKTAIEEFWTVVSDNAGTTVKNFLDYSNAVVSKIKSIFSDIKNAFLEGLGEDFLKGFSILPNIGDMFDKFSGALSNTKLGKAISGISKAFNVLLEQFKVKSLSFEQWTTFLDSIAESFSKLGDSPIAMIVETFKSLGQAMLSAFDSGGKASNFIGALARNFEKLGNFVESIKNLFKELSKGESALSWLGDPANAFLNFLESLRQPAVNAARAFGTFLSELPGLANNAFSKFMSYAQPVIDFLTSIGASMLDTASGFLSGLGSSSLFSGFSIDTSGLSDSFGAFSNGLKDITESLRRSPIGTFLSNLSKPFEKFSKVLDEGPAHLDDWKAFLDGVTGAFSSLIDQINPIETVTTAIGNFVESMKGFGTIEFKGIGSLAGDNAGVASLLDTISKAASGMYGAIRSGLPTIEQFKSMLDKAAGKASDFLKAVKPVTETIGKKLGEAFQNAIEFVQGLIGQLSESDIGSSVLSALESIGGALGEFFASFEGGELPNADDIIQFITGIADAIGSFVSDVLPKLSGVGQYISDAVGGFKAFETIGGIIESVAKALDKANPTLETTSTAIKTMSDSVEKPISTLSKSLGRMSDSVNDVGDRILTAEDAFSEADGGLGSVLSSLATTINSGVEQILPLAIAAAFIYRISAFMKDAGTLLKTSGTFFQEMTALPKNISKFFKGLGDSFKKKGTTLGLARDIILELVALVAALYLLSTVDSDKLWTAVRAIGVLFLMVAAITAGLIAAQRWVNKINPMAYEALGAAMVGIAASLLIVAIAVKLLAGMKMEDVAAPLLVMAGALVSLCAAALIVSTLAPTMSKAGLGLMLMALALVAFGGAVLVFNAIPWTKLGQGIFAVILALAAFTLVTRFIGDSGKGMAAAGLGLLLFAAAIFAFFLIIQKLNTVKWDTLGNGIISFIGLLILVGIALFALSKIAKDATKSVIPLTVALIAVSVAMLILVGSIYLLANMSGDITGAVVALGIMIVVFLGMLAVFMKFAAAGPSAALAVGAIVAMTIAIIAMTACIVVLTAVAQAAGPAMILAVVCLAALIAAFVLLGSIVGGNALIMTGLIVLAACILALNIALLIGAVGMTIMCGALAVLVALAVPSANAIATAMNIMAEAFVANAGALLGIVGTTAIAGLALLVFGAGCAVAAVGVMLLSGALALTGSILGSFVDAIVNFDFGAVGANIINGITGGIQMGLGTMGSALSTAGSMIIDTLTGLPDQISGTAESTKAASQEVANSVTEPIEEIPEKTKTAADESSNVMNETFGDGGSIQQFVGKGMGSLSKDFGGYMDGFTKTFEDGSLDITAGFGDNFDISGVSEDQMAQLASNFGVDINSFKGMIGNGALDATSAFDGNFNITQVATEEMGGVSAAVASTDVKSAAISKGQELKTGFQTGANGTRSIGADSAKQVGSGAKSVNLSNDGWMVGHGLTSGILAGLNAGAAAIYARAEAIARTAALKAKSGAQVNSPSKLTIPVGEGIAEGLVVGMENMRSQVESAGTKLGRSSALAVSMASEIANSIDWDSQPTIRPVLDLSSIQNGMGEMDRMFQQSSMLRSAGMVVGSPSIGSQSNSTSMVSSNDVYNFNLDYSAGTDAVQLITTIANALRRSNALKGV